MITNRYLRILLLAAFAFSLTGCLIIPIPEEETLVFGQMVEDSSLNSNKSSDDVKAKFGRPLLDFGPGRVFVYMWTVQKGKLFWVFGGPPGAIFGAYPLHFVNLFFVAFGDDGKLFKKGAEKYKEFDTIAEQVRNWLSENGLANRVVGPRVGQTIGDRSVLFVYRPSWSPCGFPLFDSNILHSSVSVDGQVVGDVAKGEYLGVELSPGEHIIKFDPQPYYQFGGAIYPPGTSSISTTPIVTAELGKAIYIRAYNCTGYGGMVKGYSEVRDAAKAREEIQGLESAW